MPTPPPPAAVVAVLAPMGSAWAHAPALAPPPGSAVTLIRCATTAELVVALRAGPHLDAAVIDGTTPGVDRDLLGEVARRGSRPVIVDEAPHRRAWHELGAELVLSPHADLALAIGATAGRSAPAIRARAGPGSPGVGSVGSAAPAATDVLAPLAVVTGGPGTDPAAIAVSLARSLGARLGAERVALVDLTLDGCHRGGHGLGLHHAGLPELVEALRHHASAPQTTTAYGHEASGGYRVIPGLRRHRDWVHLGSDSLAAALRSLRLGSAALVAHADPDVEGHEATGSFDIEDRNLLARTAFATADLAVLACPPTDEGIHWLRLLLPELVALGLPEQRARAVLAGARPAPRPRPVVAEVTQLDALTDVLTGALRPGALPRGTAPAPPPSWIAALRQQLGRHGDDLAPLVDALLLADRARADHSASDRGHTRIEPGELGHWSGDAPGWITPSVPQHP